MCTKFVVSPNIADAACCAVRATSSVSIDDCAMDEKSPTDDDPPPPLTPPLLISFLRFKMMSFALSKSFVSCTHSLVFSSS